MRIVKLDDVQEAKAWGHIVPPLPRPAEYVFRALISPTRFIHFRAKIMFLGDCLCCGDKFRPLVLHIGGDELFFNVGKTRRREKPFLAAVPNVDNIPRLGVELGKAADDLRFKDILAAPVNFMVDVF
ncbi:MAG: hypothetical protein LBK98_08005 [Peptococcaceae bacterium]|nr:hypothetical protein [Peptococcaceae bacterium]